MGGGSNLYLKVSQEASLFVLLPSTFKQRSSFCTIVQKLLLFYCSSYKKKEKKTCKDKKKTLLSTSSRMNPSPFSCIGFLQYQNADKNMGNMCYDREGTNRTKGKVDMDYN